MPPIWRGLFSIGDSGVVRINGGHCLKSNFGTSYCKKDQLEPFSFVRKVWKVRKEAKIWVSFGVNKDSPDDDQFEYESEWFPKPDFPETGTN